MYTYMYNLRAHTSAVSKHKSKCVYIYFQFQFCNISVSAFLDGLTGGWVPDVLDTNQWIQVDMQEPYIYTQVNGGGFIDIFTSQIGESGYQIQ